MELKKVEVRKSLISNRVQLVGEVIYDDHPNERDYYWFEINESLSESFSRSGNPWIACLLPLAMTLGQPLRLALPIDIVLFKNLNRLIKIWRNWYPRLVEPTIEAELNISSVEAKPINSLTASFFSGGIDSFFTLLHCHLTSSYPIDELLFIDYFGKIRETAAFNRLNRLLQKAAHDLNHSLISITTNLRKTRWRKANWVKLSHGAALASVALALENRYKRALISSSHNFNNMLPWGSTFVTDRLFSTSKTEIVHYGFKYSRVQKTELISKSEIALRSLKVCYKSRSDFNCSNCQKCYRTMINLELIGKLDFCNRFSKDKFDINKISKVFLKNESEKSFFAELEALALSKGRIDIAKNIRTSYHRSNNLKKILCFLAFINNLSFFEKKAKSLKRKITEGYFT